jgi:hypothetical protein
MLQACKALQWYFFAREFVGYKFVSGLTNDDSIGSCELLQSSGYVGCSADKAVNLHRMIGPKPPSQHDAGLYADADREFHVLGKRRGTAQFMHLSGNRQTTSDGCLSIAIDGSWIPETREHTIAGVAHDVTSISCHSSHAPVPVCDQHRGEFLRIQLCSQGT